MSADSDALVPTQKAVVTFVESRSSYGVMRADDTSIAVTVAAANTVYPITSGLSAGAELKDFTFQSASELVCGATGIYHIMFSMSLHSANNNENLCGQILVNGNETHYENDAECINAGKPVSISASGVIAINSGDVITLGVENETAAHNITVTHATVSAIRIY